MNDDTERLIESFAEVIQWIVAGLVAAMAIRISDATSNYAVIGIALLFTILLGGSVNYLVKSNKARVTAQSMPEDDASTAGDAAADTDGDAAD